MENRSPYVEKLPQEAKRRYVKGSGGINVTCVDKRPSHSLVSDLRGSVARD